METIHTAGRIDVCDPARDPAWDDAVDRLPGATFFHTRAWAAVLRSAYAFTPQYLAAREGDATTGVLPLFGIHSWITGSRGIALPFTDRCEPLARDDWVAARLFRAACDLGRECGWTRLEIRGKVSDPRAVTGARYYEHSVNLAAGAEAVLAGADSAVRRAIRKAEREGVSVHFATSWDTLTEFRRLLDATRRRHGAPPQPDSFFRALHDHVLQPQRGVIALATYRNAPVAGALFLRHRRSAIFKFGASDPSAYDLRPNQLLLWRAIQRFCAENGGDLNLGRTSLWNEGLRRFKRAWGAREQLIDYSCFDLTQSRFIATPDRADGWQTVLFRRLPPWVTRSLANVVYRHFA